eukprot:588187_1
MNRTEALVPYSSGSHTKSRTNKLNSSTPNKVRHTKVIRNSHSHHHHHTKHNNNHHYPHAHTHHSPYQHHHHHPHATSKKPYSNGSTSSTTASSTNEETEAPHSSFSTLSLSPSPSPQAFHASLHNTYHHYRHSYNYEQYTHGSQHKLILLTLIYGYLRSCIPIVIKRHASHARATTMDDDMDSATDDDDEDLMQDHEPFTMEISPNILQSILLYFDDDKFNETFGGKQCGSFVWKMSTLQLLTAQSMESIPFQIGSFVWHLSVYPYGIDTEHLNFTNLYINLSSSNSTLFGRYFLFELVVNARLYCIETSSCWSSIKTFKCDSDKHGWQKGALLIHELCQYKELTFVVYINILRIRGYDKRIWYQYPLQLPAVNECNKFVLKWKIDSSLLCDLRNANEMKRFESDICNNMWVLGCVPNGIKKDNEASVFKIYLKLCALPPNISKIKVKFNIICIETKKHIKYIYNDFDYKHKYWQTDKLCKRNYLIFNDFDTLRFKAEIEIIEQYDTNYNELSSNLWKHKIQNHTIQDMISTASSPSLSSHQLKMLVIGYTRRYIPYTVHIIAVLIDKFYPQHTDRGLFTWNINLEQIIKLSKLNAKQRFDSKIFTISNLKWFLQIYPNGYRPEDEGFCSVYLILAYLPSILKEITIHFSVYCPQTMSNFSTIHTFNHSRDGRGTRRMLSLRHLNKIYYNGYDTGNGTQKEHKFISFDCCINILRIRNDRHHIIYQYPFTLDTLNTHVEWKIDPAMMNKFKQSNNGQRFESAIFNQMWNLSIFPNENKNKSKSNQHTMQHMIPDQEAQEPNVVIGIRLCALPKDVMKMRVHYKLLCVEFESDNLDIACRWAHTALFDYDNYYVKFPKHTIPSHYINTYKQLTFQAQIQIVQIYDLNEKIVDKYTLNKAIQSI